MFSSSPAVSGSRVSVSSGTLRSLPAVSQTGSISLSELECSMSSLASDRSVPGSVRTSAGGFRMVDAVTG